MNKPVEGNASIRSMFGNVSTKKKDTKVKLDNDDLLADILNEINPNESEGSGSKNSATEMNSKPKSSVSATKMNEKTEMALAQDYIAKLSRSVPRKKEVKTESTSDDVS